MNQVTSENNDSAFSIPLKTYLSDSTINRLRDANLLREIENALIFALPEAFKQGEATAFKTAVAIALTNHKNNGTTKDIVAQLHVYIDRRIFDELLEKVYAVGEA